MKKVTHKCMPKMIHIRIISLACIIISLDYVGYSRTHDKELFDICLDYM